MTLQWNQSTITVDDLAPLHLTAADRPFIWKGSSDQPSSSIERR
jgi:hypothetical protein